MPLLESIKDDFTALTHCKVRGHTIKESVLRDIRKQEGWTETQCEKCHYSVFVRIDPDDKTYYLISDDV